jgi:hypothetical protein
VVDVRAIMILVRQIGQMRRGFAMTDSRHHFRLSWIALAAIVGMFSVAGDASASGTSGGPRNDARACCLKRVCTVCCCTPASASSGALTTGLMVALTPQGSGLSAPARPCECRSSEPGSPGLRHESRSSEDRADQALGKSALLNVYAPTAVTSWLKLPNASPPKSPLYLRTARLLI